MAQSVRNHSLGRGRVTLYALAFPAAVALDALTPLGIADWLLEVLLTWVACLFGTSREMRAVFIIGSFIMLCGLWSSPATVVPLWMGTLNRLVAIAVMWTMVNTAERRRAAEEAEREAQARIKVLQGLLPICCVCKSIRNAEGQWHKLETYLLLNSEATLTHGFCPPCAAKYDEQFSEALPNLLRRD